MFKSQNLAKSKKNSQKVGIYLISISRRLDLVS